MLSLVTVVIAVLVSNDTVILDTKIEADLK